MNYHNKGNNPKLKNTMDRSTKGHSAMSSNCSNLNNMVRPNPC
jgi:hypothetical protein